MKELLEGTYITTIFLAIVGGIARYLQQLMNEKEKFSWLHFVAHMLIGGLTGFSMAKFGAYLSIDTNLQHLMAAWGGVVGLKAFELVQVYVIDKKAK